MNILIIEDEQHAANRLEKLVLEIEPKANVLDKIDSVESAVKWLSSNPAPDLLLLDIQLADGLSFEIFNQVEIICPVVFTTAYDEFAIKAFEINSLDYLLKPIKKEKLEKSISKYTQLKNYFSDQNLSGSINRILENFNQKKSGFRNRFLVNLGSRLIPVSINEVAYFYAEDKIVFLITQDEKKYMVNFSLEKLEEELDPSLFFRANRQYIISVNSIINVHTYFNYKLKVDVNPQIEGEIIISRKKAKDFKEWLGE